MKRSIPAVLLVAGTAFAHHAAAPHFDLAKTIELKATITKFEFVNPHGYVYFDVMADGKKTPWRCELPAKVALARLGWTQSTFTPGQQVTIKGNPARREENVCMLTSFIGADGRELRREANLNRLNGVTAKPVVATSEGRAAKLPNGQPNLAGYWVMPGGPGGGGGGRPGGGPPGGGRGPGGGGPGMRGPGGPGGGPGGGRVQLTEAAKKVQEKYEQPFDDPAIKCSPANILFGWTHDSHVNEITQTDKTITLKYGYMDFVRTIHLNAKHPAKITPSLGGHSVGTWEGDTLVVDTVGFAPGILMPMNGLPYSDAFHVVERFTVDAAAGTLTRSYVADDAKYFVGQNKGQDVMRISNEPFVPYACKELSGKNNQRPTH